MPTPTAGDLRHQVALERLPYPPPVDEFNQPKQSENDWERLFTKRCRIRDMNGGEIWYAKQVVSEVNLAVDIRYIPELAKWKHNDNEGPKYRLVEILNGEALRVLNIGAVRNPDGIRIWHLILAKA